MSRPHRHIHPSHQEVVDRLEERYAHLGLRFDTGFAGSVPVQASGRIGRRFFHFRFRHDTAALTVGSPDLHSLNGQAERKERAARRTLRRHRGRDVFLTAITEVDLRQRGGWETRYPHHPVRRAWVHDVTGNEYNGYLEQDEAEELFIRLMDRLRPARQPRKNLRRALRHCYTLPMTTSKTVIRKRSAR